MSGALWALASGAGFGLFQSLNRRAVKEVDALPSTFSLLVGSALVLSVIALATDEPSRIWRAPPSALFSFFLASFFHFLLGWTLLNTSQKRIGAARTSPLLSTTPVFATVLAALLLAEVPSVPVLLSVAVVVSGVYVISAPARDPRPVQGVATGWRASMYGIGAATCWAVSPLFIRHGLVGLDSPLLGVTTGLWGCAALAALILLVRPKRLAQPPAGEEMAFRVAAAVLVGLATWARWMAVDLIPISVALALTQVSVPIVLLVSPLVSGRHLELVSARLWLGAALVVGGSSVLLMYR